MADKALTVEELQAALETSKKESSTLKGQLTVASKNLEAKDVELTAKANENEDLKKQVAEGKEALAGSETALKGKEAENLELKTQVDGALEIIKEQSIALTKAEDAGPDVIITFDKKKYKVTAKSFNIAGTVVTAAELKTDKVLQEKLISKKSSILQPIE